MLSSKEKFIAKESVRAALEGPFFEEWEFNTLFPFDKQKLQKIYNEWNENYFIKQQYLNVIKVVIGLLISYPHKQEGILETNFNIDLIELDKIYNKIVTLVQNFKRIIKKSLMNNWDPIGIRDLPEGEKEYDSYVDTLYNLLEENISEQELFDYLWKVETEEIGFVGDRRKTEAFAHLLKNFTLEGISV